MSIFLGKEFLPFVIVDGKPMVPVVIDENNPECNAIFHSILEAKAFIENYVRQEGRLDEASIDELVKANRRVDAQWLAGFPADRRNQWLQAVDEQKRAQWVAAIEQFEKEHGQEKDSLGNP